MIWRVSKKKIWGAGGFSGVRGGMARLPGTKSKTPRADGTSGTVNNLSDGGWTWDNDSEEGM